MSVCSAKSTTVTSWIATRFNDLLRNQSDKHLPINYTYHTCIVTDLKTAKKNNLVTMNHMCAMHRWTRFTCRQAKSTPIRQQQLDLNRKIAQEKQRAKHILKHKGKGRAKKANALVFTFKEIWHLAELIVLTNRKETGMITQNKSPVYTNAEMQGARRGAGGKMASSDTRYRCCSPLVSGWFSLA